MRAYLRARVRTMRACRANSSAPSIPAFRAWKVSYLLGARELLVYIGQPEAITWKLDSMVIFKIFSYDLSYGTPSCFFAFRDSVLHFLFPFILFLFLSLFPSFYSSLWKLVDPAFLSLYGVSSRKQEKGFARRGPLAVPNKVTSLPRDGR